VKTRIIWKENLERDYNIHHIAVDVLAKLLTDRKVLWTTRCCKTKYRKSGRPTELYNSYITRYFYRFAIDKDLPYAIISDKYGLHFSDETLPYYNIHPSALSLEEKLLLCKDIYKKAKSRGFNKLVFYNNSPLMSKPYLEMLSEARLKVFFTTRLV
jgi:hypothetical protein